MNITDVQIQLINDAGRVKAVATIVVDNAIAVHDIKIIEGDRGLFMAMPDRKCSDGKYRDITHPINHETRFMIQDAVIDKYKKVLAEEGE